MNQASLPPGLRSRLLDRVARSARASRAFVTVRGHARAAMPLADGVAAQLLYVATGADRRAGEPSRVRIIDLAAGRSWMPDLLSGEQTEWLVLSGALELGGQPMGPRDFHWSPPGAAAPNLRARSPARVLLREAGATPGADALPAVTQLDAVAGWDDFAPGIQRRLLWSCAGEAAMLYQAAAGSQVPGHGHLRDEECLMVCGELFLDDVLLREGDYQLAPAGTRHGGVSTDVGGIVFAHGDLDLDILPA